MKNSCGYTWVDAFSNFHIFIDIDECTEGCDPIGGTCANHDGGFHCECNPGYSGSTCSTFGKLEKII